MFNASLAGDLQGVRQNLQENLYTNVDGDLLESGLAQILDRDPKGWGRRPIHVATIGGHLEIVEILVESGAQVTATNTYGDTALHFAVHHNRFRILSFLLQHGANPSLKNNVEISPLDIAMNLKKNDFVEEMENYL